MEARAATVAARAKRGEIIAIEKLAERRDEEGPKAGVKRTTLAGDSEQVRVLA